MHTEPVSSKPEKAAEKIVLCDAAPTDVAWALDRWVSSAVKAFRACLKHPSLSPEDKRVLWVDLEFRVKAILDRTYLRVARIGTSTVGFAVLDDDCVHYVYVTDKNRRKGVATRLIADMVTAPWFFSSRDSRGLVVREDADAPRGRGREIIARQS